MDLYALPATNFQLVFGTFDEPMQNHGVTVIGRLPDDSEFLIFALTGNVAFTTTRDLSEYVFTYNQSWTDKTDQAVVDRTKADLINKHNADIAAQILALEAQSNRPQRELSRQQVAGDVNPDDIAFAQSKILQIDDQIKTLRGQLITET